MKLELHDVLSSFAFKFNLRRCIEAAETRADNAGRVIHSSTSQLNLSRICHSNHTIN